MKIECPVRLATLDDIPWLATLIKGFYGDLVDIERCEDYYRKTIGRPDHCYFRGEYSAGAAKSFLPWWAPLDSQPLASDIFFCPAQEKRAILELVEVMRAMVNWAAKANCRQLSFTALNGVDIESIAKRAGADKPMPSFRIIY